MPQPAPSRFIRLDRQVWIMLGAFALAALFLAGNGYRHAREVAATEARFAAELTNALAAHANLGFAEIDRDLQLAARDLVGADGRLRGDTASRHRLLAGIAAASSSIQSLLLHDATGRSVAESAWPEPRPLMAADRDYFTAHAAAGAPGLVIAPPVRSRLSGLMSLAVSRALRDGTGQLLGVVVAHIAPSYFDALAVRFGTRPGHMIALVGDDGIVRYASDPAWLGQDQDAVPGWARGDGLVTRQGATLFDGAERDYRLRRLDAYPLTLVTGTATTGTAALLWRTATDVGPGLAALLLLMAGGVAAFLLYKRRAEDSLAAADAETAKLQAVAQMVPGLVYQWRHDGSGAGRFVWVSPRSRDLLGIEAERFLPR